MSDSVIELNELHKTFYIGFRRKRVDAVCGLTFKVEPGEIFGLIGPNGAGKTTTIKMLTGLIRPTSGSMKIMGFEGFDRRCSRRLGYLPEISYYYESLTAAEILDFYAKLYGISEDRQKKVDYWLERVGMTYARNKRLGQFSKGMVQRIGLAQALIGDPDLVILDEPQSGLDPIGRRDVADIIKECQKQGKTVFFSSHILPDVERLCDRVGVIRKGKMEVIGTLHDLMSKDRHIEIEVRGNIRPEFVQKLAQAEGIVCSVKDDTLNIALSPQKANEVNDILMQSINEGLNVEHVIERGQDLEALFTKDNEKPQANSGKTSDPPEDNNSIHTEEDESQIKDNGNVADA